MDTDKAVTDTIIIHEEEGRQEPRLSLSSQAIIATRRSQGGSGLKSTYNWSAELEER